MVAVIVVVLLLAAYFGYAFWLRQGVRARTFSTALPADRIRAIFVDKVARAGWAVVDDGNPLVAQSPLLTGVRQQIGLRTSGSGRVNVDVRPMRLQVKVLTRVPTKGHTLRIRMNSFVAEVRRQDPSFQLAAH